MISKVAVIGSGTMGCGIAAQLANADIDVMLLDVKADGNQPSAVAEQAIERIRNSDPPLIVHPDVMAKIVPGNVEDDLHQIATCDWIVEAIVERLDVKRDLYRQIDQHRKPDAIVSSNTSTIPMALLIDQMPKSFRQHFAITHFFNPVRYMRLLELVRGEETDSGVMDVLCEFNDKKMGKGIVMCRDTPGFLANRVGVFALQVGIDETIRCGLTVEEADALMGRPMGIPKTGVFGLYDLIGLDLMVDVVHSLKTILPTDDPFHTVSNENPLIAGLINQGHTGLKGNGGFYRKGESGREVVDLHTGQYRAVRQGAAALAEAGEAHGVSALLEGDSAQHRFCRRVLARVLAYAASLLPEVAATPIPIDDAMKLGYNWTHGPFELIDDIGVKPFIQLLSDESLPIPSYLQNAADQFCYQVDQGKLNARSVSGKYCPVIRAPGVMRFNEVRRTLTPLRENVSASLFKLEGSIGLIEFHSKANALDDASMAIVRETALRAADEFRGIIVHNDAAHFSAGVNLHLFRQFIEQQDWQGIDSFLRDFQEAVNALKYCPVPVVAAPSGLAIGGGYEVLAHCDVVVAHTNVVLGLVESLVGLVPGGGGVKDTLYRWYKQLGKWDEAARRTFENIGYGKTGTSPQHAASLAYFRPGLDQQVMNRDRLIETARQVIGGLTDSYVKPKKPVFNWVGRPVFQRMQEFLAAAQNKGQLTAHDVVVGTEIARIVTGGDIDPSEGVSESALYRSERQAFVTLAQTKATHARIAHMLDHGGILRN